MARKKKGNAVASDAPYNGGSRHWSIGVDEADNGFIVHTSSEGKDGYISKKSIAPNERGALRIAAQHLSNIGKGKGKKGKKKKIAMTKRG